MIKLGSVPYFHTPHSFPIIIIRTLLIIIYHDSLFTEGIDTPSITPRSSTMPQSQSVKLSHFIQTGFREPQASRCATDPTAYIQHVHKHTLTRREWPARLGCIGGPATLLVCDRSYTTQCFNNQVHNKQIFKGACARPLTQSKQLGTSELFIARDNLL